MSCSFELYVDPLLHPHRDPTLLILHFFPSIFHIHHRSLQQQQPCLLMFSFHFFCFLDLFLFIKGRWFLASLCFFSLFIAIPLLLPSILFLRTLTLQALQLPSSSSSPTIPLLQLLYLKLPYTATTTIMNRINVVQEPNASKMPDLQRFCAEMKVLTQSRYLQALCHVGAIKDTTHAKATTAAATAPAPPTVTPIPPPTSLPCYKIYRNWHPEDLQRKERHLPSIIEDSSGFKKKKNPTTFLLSYPAEKYNGMQRAPEDSKLSPIANPFFNLLGLFFCATATAITPLPSTLTPLPTAPLSPVPFIHVHRDNDNETTMATFNTTTHSPSTTTTTTATTDSSAPVETSPYGTERYQVHFQDLERTLFPEYHLFFADFYRVKEDWYIQLVVVPNWNCKLEEQCRAQGLIELDVERNPFFFKRTVEAGLGGGMGGLGVGQVDCRHPNSNGSGSGFRKPLTRRPSYPSSSSCHYHHATTNTNITTINSTNAMTTTETKNYEYRVYTHPKGYPKVWTELLVGCDVLPTFEVGEKVQCLLHENVRRTPNTLSIHQERQQLATILEGVALDIEQIAGRLRGGTADKPASQKEGEGRVEGEEEQEEMKRFLELTYRLSRDRTRLGILQSNAAAPAARSRVAQPARMEQ